MQELQITIEKRIQSLIETNKIKMIPRSHFVLKGLLVVAATIFAFVFAVFMFSFVLFRTRLVPPHAFGEVMMRLDILPIIMIALLFFIAGTVMLLSHKYQFVYKFPALVTVIFFIVIISGVSIWIDTIKIHDRLRHRLPVFYNGEIFVHPMR
jgi:hypothetical protein